VAPPKEAEVASFYRQGEKIHEHYYIGEMYSDSYFRKARIGIHVKTGIERAIIQKTRDEVSGDLFIQRLKY
jgi:hypothetical protein